MADEHDSTRVWGGKRWTLVASCIAVLVVIAGAIWIVIGHGSPKDNGSAANGTTSTTTQPATCPLASRVSTALPSATAPPTTWVDVEGFYFPVTADGPLFRNGGSWTCFAHTPMGGLLTATSSAVAGVYGDREAYAGFFPPGHWSQSQLDSQVPAGGQLPQQGTKIVGYEFGSWSANGGSVSLIESCTGSSCQAPYYALAVQVQWVNDRWFLVGDSLQVGTATPLDSLVGVTPWEAS